MQKPIARGHNFESAASDEFRTLPHRFSEASLSTPAVVMLLAFLATSLTQDPDGADNARSLLKALVCKAVGDSDPVVPVLLERVGPLPPGSGLHWTAAQP